MVTALPAALILMGHYFFLAKPMAKGATELRRQIEVARTRVPSPREQAETLAELVRLQGEVKKREELERERVERAEATLAYWSDRDARARGGEFIGNVLAEHGIVLVEESVAEKSDEDAYAALLKALPQAELWRLRLAGKFAQIRAALAAFGETELPLVPAAIEMEPLAEGNRSIHLWTLWICR
jgi:hypothetical protein